MTRERSTSRASARQMKGELREGKSRLDCEIGVSRLEGWVMAFSARGTRPRKALCHDTGEGDCEAGEEGESGECKSQGSPSLPALWGIIYLDLQRLQVMTLLTRAP
jgi:hypothetical protein